jgi:hypothetical protein
MKSGVQRAVDPVRNPTHLAFFDTFQFLREVLSVSLFSPLNSIGLLYIILLYILLYEIFNYNFFKVSCH